jgi:hypothetical protein
MMGYALQTEVQGKHVHQMIALALVENAAALVGTADPDADLAAVVMGDPLNSATILYPKLIVAPDNIDAETNKSTMKGAVWNTTSKAVLRAVLIP